MSEEEKSSARITQVLIGLLIFVIGIVGTLINTKLNHIDDQNNKRDDQILELMKGQIENTINIKNHNTEANMWKKKIEEIEKDR